MSSSPITTRADTGPTKAINFIGELATRDPSMPLGAVLVLLYLHEKRDLDPGVTLRQLRADLGMGSTIATRSIYYWHDQTISVAIDLNVLAVVLRPKSSLNPRPDLMDDCRNFLPQSHQFVS